MLWKNYMFDNKTTFYKYVRFYSFTVSLSLALLLTSCTNNPKPTTKVPLTNNPKTETIALAPESNLSQVDNTKEDANTLVLNKIVEGLLNKGEKKSYPIKSQDKEYITISLTKTEQEKLVFQVIDPNGQLLDESKILRAMPNKTDELISFITETSGQYKIQVTFNPKVVESINFKLGITEQKLATQKEYVSIKSVEFGDRVVKLFLEANYPEALKLAQERLDLVKDFPDLQEDLTATINDLGVIYRTIGDYEKAEKFLVEALELREKAFGANSNQVAQALNNLAGVYRFKGDYEKAEKSYSRSVAIREKIAPDSNNLSKSLFNLGHFYHIKGDYEKAEAIYLRCFEILKKIKADEIEIANIFHNLGQIAKDRKQYSQAEKQYLQAIAIREKFLKPDHPLLAFSINCLAEIEKIKGNNEKAEQLYFRAISAYEKKGIENSELANFLNVLGDVYTSEGKYEKAQETLLRSLAISEKKIGTQHPNIIDIYKSLVNLYRNKGDIDLAVKYQVLLDESDEQSLLRNLGGGSERQKLAYLNRFSDLQNTSISFHLQSAPNNIVASQTALTTILRRKGRALDVLAQNIEGLRQRATLEDQELLNTLADRKKIYSNLSLELTLGGVKAEDIEKIKSKQKELAEEIDKLEIQVGARSSEFRSQNQKITLERVKQAIPNNAVLVEFATYNPYDFKTRDFTSNPHYVVYTLDNKGELRFTDLGEVKKIDELINKFRLVLRDKKYSVNSQVKPLAQELYNIVMSPTLKLIGKPEHLLLSPDGLLNLIPFAALVDQKGKYLIEGYNLTYLASGRDLLRLEVKSDLSRRSLIVADPDFGLSSDNSDLFDSLPETEKEARVIKSLVPESDVLTKQAATETALKQVNKPKVLHIATHGFFFSQAEVEANSEDVRIIKIKRSKTTNENGQDISPLLRSGLALSGANLLSSDSGENGILTSLEVAGLDLWGTKLVVLSACDTGVGEVKSGDGVYGLRRALILSGAETQLISLWPISDLGTRDLMSEYYRQLQLGQGRGEGLRQVQLKMLKDPKRKHPFYWASFIPSGQWASLDQE